MRHMLRQKDTLRTQHGHAALTLQRLHLSAIDITLGQQRCLALLTGLKQFQVFGELM